MHISRILIAEYLKQFFPLRPFGASRNTTLHLGKDLAVSPACYHAINPEGFLLLSDKTSLLAPRGLLQTGITRYLAPPKGKCSDFPPLDPSTSSGLGAHIRHRHEAL